jgi:hypothetical protein
MRSHEIIMSTNSGKLTHAHAQARGGSRHLIDVDPRKSINVSKF